MSSESDSRGTPGRRDPTRGLERLSTLGEARPLTFYKRCLPEAATAWIGYSPRIWPAAEGLWIDLAARRLGRGATASIDWRPADAPLEDVVYLPPVARSDRPRRDRLARLHRSRGTPVLEQLLPGESPQGSGVVTLFDLLDTLLTGRLEDLAGLPAGSAVVWPLVAGLTDDRATIERHATALEEAGVRTVHFAALQLDPAARRRLADRLGEDGFEKVFHGSSLSQREVASTALAAGLAVFLDRPLPEPPLTGRDNRAIAAGLCLAAELWTQLDRNPEAGQALFRAAREVDKSRHDLTALAREQNLAVLGWLDEPAQELVTQLAAGERPALLEEMRDEYGRGAPASPDSV